MTVLFADISAARTRFIADVVALLDQSVSEIAIARPAGQGYMTDLQTTLASNRAVHVITAPMVVDDIEQYDTLLHHLAERSRPTILLTDLGAADPIKTGKIVGFCRALSIAVVYDFGPADPWTDHGVITVDVR